MNDGCQSEGNVANRFYVEVCAEGWAIVDRRGKYYKNEKIGREHLHMHKITDRLAVVYDLEMAEFICGCLNRMEDSEGPKGA